MSGTPTNDLRRYRYHTGAPLRPLRPGEACPVLFRDLGMGGMALFLDGRLTRLAGPLSPITYLRTVDYREPMFILVFCATPSALAFEGAHPGSTWRYHDSGGDPSGVTDWYAPDFDDSAWSEGAGPLGFNSDEETTLTNHGGYAYYFRLTFGVADASAVTDAFLDLTYDDGAIAYLNGVEIDRWNMPAGSVDYTTAASSGTAGASEQTGIAVDVTSLVDGTNVLAVEVHQVSTTSSDIALGARLSLAPHIQAGPYLLEPAEDGVVVMWGTYGSDAATVEYGTTASYGSTATDGSSATLHRVALSGLSADTEYHYRVRSGGYTSEDFVFRTPPDSAAETMVFAYYGDSRTNADIHGDITALIAAQQPAFVLHSGDLVDEGEVANDWLHQVFDPMAAFASSTPLVAVPGNHDSEYEHPGTLYWDYFPADPYWTTAVGPVRLIFLDSNDPDFNGDSGDPSLSAQYAWLEAALAAASEPHVLVMQHHPAYSSGWHAVDSDVQTMEAYLAPLLESYGATALLAGHDHRYERSYAAGTHYLTGGGGGASIHPSCSGPAELCANDAQQYAADSYCYTLFDLADGELWATTYDETGAELEPPVLLSNDAPEIALSEPDGLCDTVDGELTIAYSASDPDSDASIAFYLDDDASGCDGTLLVDGISEDAGDTSEVVDVSGFDDGTYSVYALVEDELEADCAYAPGAIRVAHPLTAGDVLLPLGSEWAFEDGGSGLGRNWVRRLYDDSAWGAGCGELGYGEGDEETTLDSAAATVYLRADFQYRPTPGGGYADLVLEAALDDGAVVYLNGQEVARPNMPAGPVFYGTNASASAEGAPLTSWSLGAAGVGQLRFGTNVLAVEVHQWSAGSSDLSWDARLVAVP